MKKTISLILSLIIACLLSSAAFAAEGEAWLNLTVDTTVNTPEGYDNYNFYVIVLNQDTGSYEEVNINYDNNFYSRTKLPYGNYLLASGGVRNDAKSVFSLACGQEFTIDETTPVVAYTLYFENFDVIHGKYLYGDNSMEGSLMIKTENYDKSKDVQIMLTRDRENYSYTLDSSNGFTITEPLARGVYTYEQNSAGLTPNVEKIVINGGETSVLILSGNNETKEAIDTPTTPDEPIAPDEPNIDEPVIDEEPSVDTPVDETPNAPAAEKSHTGMIIGGIAAVVLIGALGAAVIYKKKIEE